MIPLHYVTALVDLLGITDERETRITGSSSPSSKSDDTNSLNPADQDEDPKKEPKGLKLTAIPDRREGV